jgi:hypothetical protein
MISIKNGKVFTTILVLIAAFAINAATLRVSQQDGPYKTIMAAIKDAKAGDSVIITDAEVYKEQVTIDSTKNGLVLCSENPLSQNKPKIMFTDKVNVGPTTCADAKIESKITFDQNGALQIKRARGVIIDGIAVDGITPYVFGYPGIWKGATDCQWALQHGSASIVIWMSADAVVRNCDLSNSYFGIAFKDRNLGGINANINSADIDAESNVPLSGFGKTGNHLIEHNRIHNNSFGIYFESTWDLATNIRYNLIYENHHSTTAFGASVKALTSEGANQPGGAIMFKDHLYSPVAIYNNTFWHNYLIFIGGWRPANHYLIFNNIYAAPFTFWSDEPNFQNSFMALDPVFVNRMHSCVYAAQTEKPKPQIDELQEYDQTTQKMVKDTFVKYQVRIMNGFGEVEAINLTVPLIMPDSTVIMKQVSSAKVEGNLIIGTGTGTSAKPFPESADIRWLETKFKSTNPTSPDFLVPDWNDSLVNKYVLDKGWKEAGILDADGSPADLGAIPKEGTQTTVVTIKQVTPVLIDQNAPTKATVSFSIDVKNGTLTNPVVKYLTWIGPLPLDTNAFGGNGKPLPSTSIVAVTPPSKVVVGNNENVELTIPAVASTTQYGYFEMVVEGTAANGSKVQSSVGFLSYRKLDYIFDVYVLSPSLRDTLTEVTVGESYVLRIVPKKVSAKNAAFTSKIDSIDVSLSSPFILHSQNEQDTFRIVGGIPANAGKVDKPCLFTKVPEGGLESVIAAGVFSSGTNSLAIWGVSSKIKVKPGIPAKVQFNAPPSNGLDKIYPGTPYDVKLQVYDKYDNKVKVKTDVKLESKDPDNGEVDGASQVSTDTSGIASLKVKVTNGDINDTIRLVGTLVIAPGATDNARLIVGKPKNRYYIFFGDTAMYNPKDSIPVNTCTEVRVPVQIRASTNGFDTLTDIVNEFTIEFNPSQIVAYATDSESDTTKITTAKLKKGIAKIYIQPSVAASIRDGMITITDVQGSTVRVLTQTRKGINFMSCVTPIKSASYTANNGNGAVDQLDIYYQKAIKETEIPDSVEIYWPTKTDTRKMVKKTNMKLDPQDSTHVKVSLPETFPAGITASATQDLGISYWRTPTPFKISDKVGPIIKGAWLIERLIAGKSDTLIVAFSEFVPNDKVTGEALKLTTRGGIVLNVLSATQMTDNRLKIAIENKGEDKAPKDGDSIKIYVDASGVSKVVDANGTVAHKDNRPVELIIQEIAPSVDTAGYYDVNGDGTVDHITLKFNKKVKIGDQKYLAFFGNSIKTDTINSNSASYINNDSARVTLDLTGKFKGNADLKTSGDMTITVESKRFSDVIKKKVDDHAAPVIIDTVWYYQGKIFKDGTKADDTLYIAFSEQLSSQPASLVNAFKFSAKSGGEFTLSLANARQITMKNQITYEFLVKSVSGVKNVQDRDRVTIKVDGKTSAVVDALNNSQGNDPNRTAIIRVKEQPVDLNIKVGPSPFIAGGSNELKISIQPQVLEGKEVKTAVKILIFDYLGNNVYTTSDTLKSKDMKIINWNGRNQKGRAVGMGTYLILIKSKDLILNTPQKDETHKIAVKREIE